MQVRQAPWVDRPPAGRGPPRKWHPPEKGGSLRSLDRICLGSPQSAADLCLPAAYLQTLGGGKRERDMTTPQADKELVRADLLIAGKVQGVFFRGSAQAEAMRLGLLGEVGNLPDGGVEATVEGERRAVEEFIAWCRQGPPAAVVESVQVKFSAVRGEFRTFRVGR